MGRVTKDALAPGPFALRDASAALRLLRVKGLFEHLARREGWGCYFDQRSARAEIAVAKPKARIAPQSVTRSIQYHSEALLAIL